jgi:hypothetical protein
VLSKQDPEWGGSKTIAAALYLISKNKDVDEVAVKA